MAKQQDPQSFSAGSRTEKDYAPDGWQLGGRKEAETSTAYDPQLAAQHAQDHQEREGK